MADPKLTAKQMEAALDWLFHYRDGWQNGQVHTVNSVWTRGRGISKRGLATCQGAGFIVSAPDQTIAHNGYRHDITPAGRAALTNGGGDA